MQRVVLDMQNYLLGDAIRETLSREDFLIEIANKPEDTVRKCVVFSANTVIMEVTGYTPWMLCERMKIRSELREKCPDCKIVLLVDEKTEKDVAQQVKTAKQDGLIDLFLYASTSASFLAALVETV